MDKIDDNFKASYEVDVWTLEMLLSHIPEKVKLYIEQKLSNEIEYFEKKYSFKINFNADSKLIIPEYKIELLNKSKKVINTVEHVEKIDLKNYSDNKVAINKSNQTRNTQKKLKKTKSIKKKPKVLRTLWVRRKKKIVK